jgi:hypothetical protein
VPGKAKWSATRFSAPASAHGPAAPPKRHSRRKCPHSPSVGLTGLSLRPRSSFIGARGNALLEAELFDQGLHGQVKGISLVGRSGHHSFGNEHLGKGYHLWGGGKQGQSVEHGQWPAGGLLVESWDCSIREPLHRRCTSRIWAHNSPTTPNSWLVGRARSRCPGSCNTR